jgi:uncharacterized damage-inducible protein DinB
MQAILSRPGTSEFAPYYGTYVNAMPDGDVVAALADQGEETFALLSALSEGDASFRYAPGKWTIRDLVQHLADSERVFAYRALRFARGDETPLPGFDQEPYAQAAKADRRPIGELAAELRDIRRTTLALVRSFDEEMLARSGVASGNLMSVRALVWVIAGHERHHLKVLRERYLSALRR